MKPVLLSLAIALLMVGCGESSQPSESVDMTDTDPEKDAIETAVKWSKLQDRNGVKYLPNEKTPFTGRAEESFRGQKMEEGNYKEGKLHGLVTIWYQNGQKREELNWKDGKFMSAKVWKPNGKRCPLTNIDEDGNGFLVQYREDGTEKSRRAYKNGEVALQLDEVMKGIDALLDDLGEN